MLGIRSGRPSKTQRLLILVGVCIALGAALRFYNLGTHGIWYDEVLTAQTLRARSFDEVLGLLREWGDHAPLAFGVTWLLRGLGGEEWALRFPYAIVGVLVVAAFFALARALLPMRAALLATLLIATAPFAIYYSQEARPYAFVMLFTTLQMLAAYRAATRSSSWDWLALVLVSIANLYTSYLAIFATAVAFGFAGLATVALTVRGWRGDNPLGRRDLLTRWLMLALAATLTAIAYLPWLPYLNRFLERRDLGFGRLRGYNATLEDTYAAFAGLDLGGLLLVLLCIGLGAAVVWSARGRLEGWLMVLWLALPLALFVVAGGSAIITLPSRYFSFLFPAAILLVALGVHTLADGVGILALRIKSRANRNEVPLGGLVRSTNTQNEPVRVGGLRSSSPRIYSQGIPAILALLILVQTTPALLQQYTTPKAEFREAARHVISSSLPGSAVLVIGAFNTSPLPPFVRETVAYYYELWNAPVEVIDGTRLGRSDLELVNDTHGSVWAALFTEPSPSDLESARAAGFEVLKLNSITLLRPIAQLTGEEQALALLRWGSGIYPALSAARAVFDEEYRQSALGENLLPPAYKVPANISRTPNLRSTGWTLGSEAQLDPQSNGFLLSPTARETAVTLDTWDIKEGQVYVLLFNCDGFALDGEQRVFIDSFDAAGNYLETLPEGYGYLCLPGPSMPLQATAFRATNGIATLRVRLTANGTGTARYSDVELRPVLIELGN